MVVSKTFDLSKLRKSITKSIDGMAVGYTDPTVWLSSGSYALNWMLTKDFNKAFPLDGRFNMLVGDSGAGKSYIASGNVIRDALAQDITVILIDTENRMTEEWLSNLDVDPNHPNLQRLQTNSMENCMSLVNLISDQYKDQNKDIPYEDHGPVLIVIDSLGALFPEGETERFDKGEVSQTDGMRRAGVMTKMIGHITTKIAAKKIGVVMTNHVYAATDMYSDDSIPGGKRLVFMCTNILQMNKLKLKAKDVEGGFESDKDSDVVGIRSKCKIYKSDYNKPFEVVEVQIPYSTGMNPYSGLFDLFESKKLLVREGNRYTYKSLADGKVLFTEFRKNYTNEMFDIMMKDFQDNYGKNEVSTTVQEITKVAENQEDEDF